MYGRYSDISGAAWPSADTIKAFSATRTLSRARSLLALVTTFLPPLGTSPSDRMLLGIVSPPCFGRLDVGPSNVGGTRETENFRIRRIAEDAVTETRWNLETRSRFHPNHGPVLESDFLPTTEAVDDL